MEDPNENVPTRAPGEHTAEFVPVVIDPRSKVDSNVFPLDGIDLETVSDEDLIQLSQTAPILYQVCGTNVVRLSQNLVLKSGSTVLPSEARVLKMLLEGDHKRDNQNKDGQGNKNHPRKPQKSNGENGTETPQLPVPRVYRAFQVRNRIAPFGTEGYIVMDYIKGENLGDCWKHLSLEQKKDIVLQTVEIIKQLQCIKLRSAGPLGGGICTGRFFTDHGAGPFSSGSAMESWFNRVLLFSKKFMKTPASIEPFKFSEFVIVHQDISPRNMIVDPSGKIWLVDWANAGAYPPFFERAAFANQQRFPEFNRMMLKKLHAEYPAQEETMKAIENALTNWAATHYNPTA